jgi:hypothetical protein
MPVIPVTQEVEIGGSWSQRAGQKIKTMRPYLKNKTWLKR